MTTAMLQALRTWTDAGWLRELDLAFADFVAPTGTGQDPLVHLAAALLSHQVGRSQVRLDLAATLAEPPARFHERHRAARWAVVGRGLTPWLVGLGIVAVALWARQNGGSSVLALLANVAPPLLMGLFFVRREMPRIALPHWPGRLADDAWPVRERPLNEERA